MLHVPVRKILLVVSLAFLASCEPENVNIETPESKVLNSLLEKSNKDQGKSNIPKAPKTENLRDHILEAVSPTECGATEFTEVVWRHFSALASDELAVASMDHYLFLQQNAVRLGIGTDYFGRNGEYTKHVERTRRSLERFWNMHNQIRVLGQHNETLDHREKLSEIIWYSMQDLESKEDVYPMVDEILERNKLSPVLPDSPFFAADGVARPDNEIILGDGLIQMFSETGLEESIVWSGILSHEWAHQVQFDHFASWYPAGTFSSTAEETRAVELEADFFSGYYLTHKRGATFNWKNVEQFFELFYQSGDCSFNFEQHHGTPLQRRKATFEGYLLAEAASKKGHILKAEELHEIFVKQVLPQTVSSL
ncbi:hypothetical protein [Salinimicrobium oceani]|uniref:Peptidase MA superfamily protein n=1 Tax=Salinimicrobium oceani TaxID=2722702 RepID=A0ABX1CSY0_9FLAO|nr:hypothetical protein [Salinimicrobium oceani]NJW51411.1 hypothetical protein [Salinimicrobium oceani]